MEPQALRAPSDAGTFSPERRSRSHAQQVRRDERKYDGRVRLDDVARARHVELSPGDLLVRDRTAVRPVRRGRIRDLAEVRPLPDRRLQVLLDERHDADRKVTRDASTDLEEADGGLRRVFLIPPDE